MSDPEETAPHTPSHPGMAPGTTVGRFVLGPELGRGAFGVVHRAYDPTLGREVAIKLPTAIDIPPELVERFVREARAAAGLRHPHIVAVFDASIDAGRPFITMELVDGKTLAERLKEKVSHRQAAEWVRDLALALHHAHAAGVLHRDVKPGNVLMDTGERVRLTDFGISKLAPTDPTIDETAPAVTQDGTIMGSPGYMSPEQARGDVMAVGPASDQYSLGVMLYELLLGRRVFQGSASEIMRLTADPTVHPSPPREVDRGIPLGLEAIVLKTISKEAADRYGSLADLAVDLQRWLKGDSVSAPLRLKGEMVRVCPACQLPTKGTRSVCRLCGLSLADVPPEDSADLPTRLVRREEPASLPHGSSTAAFQLAGRGLSLVEARVKLSLFAVAVLVIGGLVTYLIGQFDGKTALISKVTSGLAIALLAFGAVLELIGLAVCLWSLKQSPARVAAVVAIACQLASPALTSTGWMMAVGPERDEIIPIWSAKESEPRYGESNYPGGPKPKVGMTKYESAFGPSVWMGCVVVGALLGVIGWVASINFLDRLVQYLNFREAEEQPGRILRMGVAIVFGPSLLLLVAPYVLLPRALFWFTILVAIASLALLITLLLAWQSLISELWYEIRRRISVGPSRYEIE